MKVVTFAVILVFAQIAIADSLELSSCFQRNADYFSKRWGIQLGQQENVKAIAVCDEIAELVPAGAASSEDQAFQKKPVDICLFQLVQDGIKWHLAIAKKYYGFPYDDFIPRFEVPEGQFSDHPSQSIVTKISKTKDSAEKLTVEVVYDETQDMAQKLLGGRAEMDRKYQFTFFKNTSRLEFVRYASSTMAIFSTPWGFEGKSVLKCHQ